MTVNDNRPKERPTGAATKEAPMTSPAIFAPLVRDWLQLLITSRVRPRKSSHVKVVSTIPKQTQQLFTTNTYTPNFSPLCLLHPPATMSPHPQKPAATQPQTGAPDTAVYVPSQNHNILKFKTNHLPRP